ncbi:MAG: hypothetical protein AB7G47_04645 [Mycolicibacterium sp.]|uniref:hypothetical protein n=1 Tax=Mycolicibacterium sp. TaxID=2320850 RepID=UPI003D12D555
MSGQLVGEVLDASPALRASGLPERGFHALVAIAEKCHHESREGSVRWDHIRAGLYGASLATAKRAVKDLKTAGIVRVVKRGFDNQHGRVCAPIYRIGPLPERVTQMTQSHVSERVTQVNQSPGGEWVKSGGRMGHIGTRMGHPGDLLDGSIDGSLDGGRAHARPAPTQIHDPGQEPPRYCPTHMPYGTHEKCGPCGNHRTNHELWTEARQDYTTATRAIIRHAIDNCRDCDQAGRLDNLQDCPKHPNFRTERTEAVG